MFICNGRVSNDKLVGNTTCVKGNSVIDYFVCSPDIFEIINDFWVRDFDPTLSDVHCALEMVLKTSDNMPEQNVRSQCNVEKQVQEDAESVCMKYKWEKDKESNFVKEFSTEEVEKLLRRMDSSENVTVCINSVCDEIVQMFKKKVEKCGMVVKYKTKEIEESHKKCKEWYNEECKKKRKLYNRARNRYLRIKSELNREDMKRACKEYKKEIRKAIRVEKGNFKKKLLSLKSKDPNVWKLLNNKAQLKHVISRKC